MYFVEEMRKEICAHEIDKNYTLVRRRELNGKKNIMYIWSFKRKRSPYGRILKHKARLCAHVGMQKGGVKYWDTYSPVVNWMSVGAILTLSILRELQTKSVDFFLAYTKAGLNTDIFM